MGDAPPHGAPGGRQRGALPYHVLHHLIIFIFIAWHSILSKGRREGGREGGRECRREGGRKGGRRTRRRRTRRRRRSASVGPTYSGPLLRPLAVSQGSPRSYLHQNKTNVAAHPRTLLLAGRLGHSTGMRQRVPITSPDGSGPSKSTFRS